MCGINGFNWRDSQLISRMNSAIRHRGPDNEGAYTDGRVTLGHVRLSIIDLTENGNQPMSNEDRSVWIVFNGEIYNFQSLRSELETLGHRFISLSDTEVVLHSYEEYGTDCVTKFNGMWAFAIYDTRRNTIFLSRDRYGVKPIYYTSNDGRFAFSSEIKGLLALDIPRIPNRSAVADYLAFGQLLDHKRSTFFEGIRRMLPGENLLVDPEGGSIRGYIWYDVASRIHGKSSRDEAEVIRCLRELFVDSVRKRMIADVQVGSCLSGGIDSSSIVSIMRYLAQSRLIETFSMVFPGTKIDESVFIDALVEAKEVESHKVQPTLQSLLADLEDLVVTQEEPFPSLSIYGQFCVLRLAHTSKLKVLLDGQGADELLAGYPYYYVSYLLECLVRMRLLLAWQVFRQCSANYPSFLREVISYIVEAVRAYSGIGRLIQTRRLKYLVLPDTMLSPEAESRSRQQGRTSSRGEEHRTDTRSTIRRVMSLNGVLLLDLTSRTIPSLLRYEDKNSMRWAVESRLPFLDYRMVEFLLPLPPEFKIRFGIRKHCLRSAMSGLVPDRILARKDKIGFVTPDDEWIRSDAFVEYAKRLFSSVEFERRPYWKSKEVLRLLEDVRLGQKGSSLQIWRLVNVELWHRAFFDPVKAPSPDL